MFRALIHWTNDTEDTGAARSTPNEAIDDLRLMLDVMLAHGNRAVEDIQFAQIEPCEAD